MAYNYDRTKTARVPTEQGAKWGDTYEKALKKLGVSAKVEIKYGGNVQTFVETTIKGKKVPGITISEDRKGPNYSKVKWAKIGTGSGAKFINAPTKMAKHVAEEYG